MKKTIILTLALMAVIGQSFAQCGTWNDLPNKDEAENAHVIYRQEIKSKNFAGAMEQWKIAFDIAPAADGKRDFHYTDGIKIYKHLYKEETDEAKKEEYKTNVIELYKRVIDCYKEKAIFIADCDDDCYDAKVGQLYGELAYEMFYIYNRPYVETLDALNNSIDRLGKSARYSELEPLAIVTVHNFKNGVVDKVHARATVDRIAEIADYNIESGDELSEYYQISKDRSMNVFSAVERDIFDCDYFKARYEPDYPSKKTDFTWMKSVFADLKRQGCADSDPFMVEVKRNYESLASSMNAAKLAEWEAKNPASLAKKAYDAGNYDEAVAKYREAMTSVDAKKQADYHFRIASIQFRKQKKYADARSSARKAAELRPNWGRPWMLIGDMYATSSRSCGDSWNQRLAVLAAIDKYSRAKSVDPSVGVEAGGRIGRYNQSRPDQQEAFMRGMSAGQTVKVACWIGESVKLRF